MILKRVVLHKGVICHDDWAEAVVGLSTESAGTSILQQKDKERLTKQHALISNFIHMLHAVGSVCAFIHLFNSLRLDVMLHTPGKASPDCGSMKHKAPTLGMRLIAGRALPTFTCSRGLGGSYPSPVRTYDVRYWSPLRTWELGLTVLPGTRRLSKFALEEFHVTM